jgi:hypothetical protein
MEIIKTLDDIDFTSFDTFFESVNGKAYNLDGENPNGAQCWAGILLLYRHLSQKLSSGGSENAKDGWLDKQARRQNGGKNFAKITKIEDIKQGDVCFFNDGESGHVAYANGTYDEKTKTIGLFGQNQGEPNDTEGSPFSVIEYPTDGFLGAYRCLKWNKTESDELGTSTEIGTTSKKPTKKAEAKIELDNCYLISPFRIGDFVTIKVDDNPVWYDGEAVDVNEFNTTNSHKVVAYKGTAVMIRTERVRGRPKYIDRPIESKYLEHILEAGEAINIPVYMSQDEPPLFHISNKRHLALQENFALFVKIEGKDEFLLLNNSNYWKLLTGKHKGKGGVVFGIHVTEDKDYPEYPAVDPANILSNEQSRNVEFDFKHRSIWAKYKHNGQILWVKLNNHVALRGN